MKRLLAWLGVPAIAALGMIATAGAAAPNGITVNPWTFVGTVADCGTAGTGDVQAGWMTHQGLPDAGNSNHALYLQKFALTADCSAAGASIRGVAGINLTE